MFTRKMFTAATAGLLAMFVAGSALAQPVAPVAAWAYITPTTSPITIDWINGMKTDTAEVTYSPAAKGIWSYDGNIVQSSANIQIAIDTQFKLAPTALTYVSGCDYPGSCNTGGDAKTVSNTFSSTKSFDYLAVHFGQGELLFQFAKPQKTFTIDGLPNGLSNYGAYVSAVPEPSEYALMVSGLGLLGFLALRKRKS